ncbi:hypothetical protein M422DRAFT_244795 [Sphaerobolus stellatus SS14]|nr:hypothetical protein M422DRAFT_244795 [Sphaerobolus stellatus SS14]
MESNNPAILSDPCTHSPSPANFGSTLEQPSHRTVDLARALYRIAPLMAAGMEPKGGDGGVEPIIVTRAQRQGWFMCTIACNVLVEARKLIIVNQRTQGDDHILKEFTPYVLYYAAASLGGVNTNPDGANPLHRYPHYAKTELKNYLEDISTLLDETKGLPVMPIIPRLPRRALQDMEDIAGPWDFEQLPRLAHSQPNYYRLFEAFPYSPVYRLIIKTNLLDPTRRGRIMQGMDELVVSFEKDGWFDPIGIQVIPEASCIAIVTVVIDWINGKAEGTEFRKTTSDMLEEEGEWLDERDRIEADQSLHTSVTTWDL